MKPIFVYTVMVPFLAYYAFELDTFKAAAVY